MTSPMTAPATQNAYIAGYLAASQAHRVGGLLRMSSKACPYSPHSAAANSWWEAAAEYMLDLAHASHKGRVA